MKTTIPMTSTIPMRSLLSCMGRFSSCSFPSKGSPFFFLLGSPGCSLTIQSSAILAEISLVLEGDPEYPSLPDFLYGLPGAPGILLPESPPHGEGDNHIRLLGPADGLYLPDPLSVHVEHVQPHHLLHGKYLEDSARLGEGLYVFPAYVVIRLEHPSLDPYPFHREVGGMYVYRLYGSQLPAVLGDHGLPQNPRNFHGLLQRFALVLYLKNVLLSHKPPPDFY